MELRAFVEESGGQTAFANRMGVSQGLVWQWLEGKTRITAERAIEIEGITGGKVSRHELRADIFGSPPAPEPLDLVAQAEGVGR